MDSKAEQTEQTERTDQAVEWPTVAVIMVVWALIITPVVAYDTMPALVAAAILLVGAGWYGSVQHEVVHGHPTRSRLVNTVLAGAPIGLTCPLSVYRTSHLAHHDNTTLTDPMVDPESRYVTAERWERMKPWQRVAATAEQSLVGWLTIGVVRKVLVGPTTATLRALIERDRGRLMVWVHHWLGVGILLWLVSRSPMPVVVFAPIAAYSWLGMAHLRSFAEHAAPTSSDDGETRSAVVRTGPITGLLLLHNNLHHTHHAVPDAPWYRLPALNDQLGADQIAANGAGLYEGGYRQLWSAYGLRPKRLPVHPGTGGVG